MRGGVVSDQVQNNPVIPDVAIDECEMAWQCFLGAVDCAPPDRVEMAGVCGDWSLKLLVGHVGYWDGIEAAYFAQGHRPDDLDWQAMNDENASANSARSHAENLDEAKSNHRRMVEIIRSNPNLDPRNVRWLTHDHDIEHANEIENWLTSSTS